MSTQHEDKIDLDQLEALVRQVKNATTSVKEGTYYDDLYGWLSLARLDSLIALARKAQEPDPRDEEILAMHRQIAAEKLRADQGWQRAEAKSRECLELRERMAAQEPAIPEGWALVPIEPTDEMIVAFAEEWYSRTQVIDDPDMVDAYRAMLAAAGVAPQELSKETTHV